MRRPLEPGVHLSQYSLVVPQFVPPRVVIVGPNLASRPLLVTVHVFGARRLERELRKDTVVAAHGPVHFAFANPVLSEYRAAANLESPHVRL